MPIKWADAITKGLKFAVQPKRWGIFFIIDLIFLGGAAAIALSNLSAFAAMMAAVTDFSSILPFLGNIAGILLLLIIWWLFRIGVTGLIIHQSFKEKDSLKKSCSVSQKRYLQLFAAMVITTLITLGVSWIPYVGSLAAIIAALIFFFVFQGVVIKGSGAARAVKESWAIFRGNPVKVFVMWLIITLIAGAINLVFSLPAMGMVFSLIFTAGKASGAAAFAAVLFSVMTNPATFVIVFLIFLAGNAISACFTLKASTEYYLQIRKRFRLF